MKSKDMVGVAKTIKEFGESRKSMETSKYVVEESDGNIEITHMKYDEDCERWLIDDSIAIPFVTAKTMFGEMSWAIENEEVVCDDEDYDYDED